VPHLARLQIFVEHRFDNASTLLYVDQVYELSFDTVDKIRLFKSLEANKSLWITEVNWPLNSQGEYMLIASNGGSELYGPLPPLSPRKRLLRRV